MNVTLPTVVSAGFFDSRVVYPGLTRTKPRRAPHYELDLFASPGGESTLNGRTFIRRRGSILLASPGDERSSELPFTAHFIYFTAGDGSVRTLLAGLPDLTDPLDFGRWEARFSEIRAVFSEPGADRELILGAKLLSLLYDLRADCASRHAEGDGSPASVYPALVYIREHLDEPFGADELAAVCGVSTAYFQRLFKLDKGMTPRAYVERLRIARAKELLTATDAPISLVAERCGFGSQAYFSCRFGESEGISPREFRKRAEFG